MPPHLLHRQATTATSQSQDMVHGRNVQIHKQFLETAFLHPWICEIRRAVQAIPVSVCHHVGKEKRGLLRRKKQHFLLTV